MAENPQGRQPKRVVCTCFSYLCSTKTHLDIDGQSRRGRLVSTTTWSTHRARDRDAGLTANSCLAEQTTSTVHPCAEEKRNSLGEAPMGGTNLNQFGV
jgi:hypothetical protein